MAPAYSKVNRHKVIIINLVAFAVCGSCCKICNNCQDLAKNIYKKPGKSMTFRVLPTWFQTNKRLFSPLCHDRADLFGIDPHHGLAQVLRNLGNDIGIVIIGHSFDDGLRPFCRISTLKDA